MNKEKYLSVPLAAALGFTYAVPAFANTSDPVENVFVNQYATVEKTIENVSDVISNSLDSIEIEKMEPVEIVNEVIYQPEVTYVVEYVSEPVMTTYTVPVEWVSAPEEADTSAINEAQAAYDAALAAYNQAQAEYEAAGQIIETTKEVEVEVTEEIEDEEGNIVTQTRTETQIITETSYAGDVEAAQANLDAAAATLEAAQSAVEVPVTQEIIVEESETKEVVSQSATDWMDDITWTMDDGLLTISGTGIIEEDGPWGDEFTELVIKEGITGIGYGAFSFIDTLITASIPSTVTFIDERAFFNCNQLEEVFIAPGVTEIGKNAFSGCKNLRSITIPGTVNTMGSSVFTSCDNLTEVTFLEGAETIGEYAFSYCTGLSTVNLPSSIATIQKGAFYHCDGLETIELPSGLTTMGTDVFSYCVNLKNITIQSGITAIADRTFYNCKELTEIVLPDTVTSIGEQAFYWCDKLVNVTLPSNLETIAGYAFYDCQDLIEIDFPDTLTNIGEYAFYGCESLSNISLPPEITTIEERAFHSCLSLVNVYIPDTVTVIGESAFYNCPNLGRIQIPKSVTQIKDSAFHGSGLTDIYYGGTEDEWNAVTLEYRAIPTGVTIHFAGEEIYVLDAKHSLALEGNIGLNFFFLFDDSVTLDDNARVDLTLAGNTLSYLVKDARKRRIDGIYYHTFTQEVTSIQMTEEIEAKVILSGEKEVYDDTYSVSKYCYKAIGDEPEETPLKQLMHDLLNYGGYAQTAFNYKTDDLANKDLVDIDVSDVTEAMLAPYAQVASGSVEGLTYNNSSLALESKTTINHNFTIGSGHTLDEYEFMLNGEALTPVKRGKKCVVSIPNIAANDLDTMYTVTVGGFEITYSGLSYAYKAVTSAAASDDLQNLGRALYKYNKAANDYFG